MYNQAFCFRLWLHSHKKVFDASFHSSFRQNGQNECRLLQSATLSDEQVIEIYNKQTKKLHQNERLLLQMGQVNIFISPVDTLSAPLFICDVRAALASSEDIKGYWMCSGLTLSHSFMKKMWKSHCFVGKIKVKINYKILWAELNIFGDK